MKALRIVRDPRKVFFGWWMVIAGGLLCLWGYAYSAYGISALFIPISTELGFTRAKTSIAASITRFEGGLEAAFTGWASDRYGPRVLVIGGIALAGIGLMLMYWINSLAGYLIIWSVVFSTGVNLSLSMPLDVAITNWFIRKRGTALSIKTVFSGLSGVIGLPIVAWMIAAYGWRMACLIGGAILLVVGVPLAWFFIRQRRPEYYGLLPDGAELEVGQDAGDIVRAGEEYADKAGEVEFTVGQALRSRAFWLLVVAYLFYGSLTSVMNIHAIPFLMDRGMDEVTAAATMSIYITASIPARFFGGFVADRLSTRMIRFVVVGSYALQSLGVVLFLMNQQSLAVLYLFFVIYGIGMGAAMPAVPIMRARYFGRRYFGTIAGIARIMNVPAGVIGPVAAGWIYDSTGNYIMAFTIFAVALAAAAAVMTMAGPPRGPRPRDLRALSH